MKTRSWLIPLLLLTQCAAADSWGQRASNWRVYRIADGMPESVCLSVAIDPHGKVYVRHPGMEVINVLDGYAVGSIPSPGPGSSRVYESPGGQIWTAAPDGLEELRDNNWMRFSLPGFNRSVQSEIPFSSNLVPIQPVKQDRVLFLLPDGLMDFNAEAVGASHATEIFSAKGTGLGQFHDMTLARDGGLWISGARGIAHAPGPVRSLAADVQWEIHIMPQEWQAANARHPLVDIDGGVTAVADVPSRKTRMPVHFDGTHWSIPFAPNAQIRHAWRGPSRKYWSTSADSLFEYDADQQKLVENEELSVHQYNDVAIEPGGIFWLATSEGLYRYAPRLWQEPEWDLPFNSAVDGLAEDSQGRTWFASASALHCLDHGVRRDYPFPQSMAESMGEARDLFVLPDGSLVLKSSHELYAFHVSPAEYSAIQPLHTHTPLRLLGQLKEGNLCVESITPEGRQLYLYSGTSFAPFSLPLTNDLLTGDLISLYSAQNGDIWISATNGVARYRDKKWQTFAENEGSIPAGTRSFLELPDGKIWCATHNRLWQFDGRNWAVLRAGFDQINVLLRARDGGIWIGSNNGVHRYLQGDWLENGTDEGLPSVGVNQLLQDRHGVIWAATSRGLRVFHPEADPDPPRTFVQLFSDRANEIREGASLTLSFWGQDKWKYTARDRLVFSCRMDQKDWTPFQEANSISFVDLAAGKHYFQVRAMDRNGNIDPEPAQLAFAVVLPWYKESRLVSISVAGMGVALFFAALAFNRHRRLVRSYAEVERKVTERTRELEIANKELLHSQKMNALGTLSAGIAHDFNNILSIIKGSTQIIEDNLDRPDKVRVRLDRIKTVVEQGSGIVKAMLGFTRGSDLQPALCDINAVVEDTVKLLGDRFLREIDVRIEHPPGLPKVTGAKDLIQQILLNILFNAAEALTERKQVVLSAGQTTTLPPEMVLVPSPAPLYVFVSVKDFGSGIASENLPRIFEPFFTTKALSVRRGTGLGLSMVYELARKMAAGLRVQSEVNQGSTFTLYLPAASEPEPAKP